MIVDPPRSQSIQVLLDDLRLLVARNARRSRRLLLWKACAFAVAIIAATLLGMLGADSYFHLPVAWRAAAFSVLVCSLLGAAWVIRRQWRQTHFTEEQIALAIEQRSAETDNRLINTIQLARDKRVPDVRLSEAVIRENHQRLKNIELKQAASLRPMLIGSGAILGVFLGGAVLFLLEGSRFKSSLVRILLPLAKVDPAYRTRLTIEPGNVEAPRGSDVKLTIKIEGEAPDTITVIHSTGGERKMEILTLEPGATQASTLFKQVQEDIVYSVRGGDFKSESYTITVPAPASLRTVRAEIQPPAYTKLPPAKIETASGNLEGLFGSRAKVSFQFNRPVEKATLLLQKQGADGGIHVVEVPLSVNAAEAAGELLFEDVAGYRLELLQNGKTLESPSYQLRVLADQPPQARLEGLEREQEGEVDMSLPLTLVAEDDYGLTRVALAIRKADGAEKEWRKVQEWMVDGKSRWEGEAAFDLQALGVVEGDRIEVALLAQDTDPLKDSSAWTESQLSVITVGSQSSRLQLLYEQILKTETELRRLIPEQQQLADALPAWIRKLEPDSGLRWDDQDNLDALRKAAKDLAAKQEKLRARTTEIAREMAETSGNLRFSLGMLADAEMVRGTLVLEGASDQDNPQRKRAALAEARLIQERIIKSLGEILQQYGKFREDWENNHMTDFVGMLAARQEVLREESLKRQQEKLDPAMIQQRSRAAANRQKRLVATTELARGAVLAVAGRIVKVEPTLGAAFADAANQLGDNVQNPMRQAAEQLGSGAWQNAASEQTKAAQLLQKIFADLKNATAEAAKRVLARAEDKASVADQQAIEALRSALADSGVEDDNAVSPGTLLKIEETRQAGPAKVRPPEVDTTPFLLDEQTKARLAIHAGAGEDRSKSVITLSTEPGGPTKRQPGSSDLTPNNITPPPIPELLDLVGALLDEADEESKDFDILNANAAFTILDSGDIGKMGGNLNSFSASSRTGNQKPPTTSSGGASGTGRQGARSHGRNVDQVTVNRRGRDEVQVGLENAPMQQGIMKEIMSDDPQKGSSPGMGGKRVDSQDKGWATMDAGQWRDDYADKMEKPQAVAKLVDRQGAPMDPRVAALLQDSNSTQEQIVVRAKAIRKELRNLFLPTERLDDLIDKIAANLERLKETPESDLFRHQKEAMDQLRSELQVINRAYAGFHQSLPKDRRVQGRVLDEPAWQPLPGYEKAVQDYYEKLTTQ